MKVDLGPAAAELFEVELDAVLLVEFVPLYLLFINLNIACACGVSFKRILFSMNLSAY